MTFPLWKDFFNVLPSLKLDSAGSTTTREEKQQTAAGSVVKTCLSSIIFMGAAPADFKYIN